MAKIMLETFGAPAVAIVAQPLLCLLAAAGLQEGRAVSQSSLTGKFNTHSEDILIAWVAGGHLRDPTKTAADQPTRRLLPGCWPHLSSNLSLVPQIHPIKTWLGCVVDSGSSVTFCVVVVEGHVVPISMTTAHLGGWDVDRYLARLLSYRGYSFTTTAEQVSESVCTRVRSPNPPLKMSNFRSAPIS